MLKRLLVFSRINTFLVRQLGSLDHSSCSRKKKKKLDIQAWRLLKFKPKNRRDISQTLFPRASLLLGI